jgi:hypothetical protein
MMSVSKSTCERYTIRTTHHEYGSITLSCWDNPPNGQSTRTEMYFGGEIMINSSFGSWGNSWNACGVPFKQFLIGIEFDYCFTKFMGHKLQRFDGETSVRELLRSIASKRREGALSKPKAREAWELVKEHSEEAESCQHGFGTAMLAIASELHANNPMIQDFADPCAWQIHTRYDPQAVGFWREIWPEFIEALKAETGNK